MASFTKHGRKGEETKLRRAIQELAAEISGLQMKAPVEEAKGGLWDRLTSWAK